ncbi:MAG TPA: hypothetical protein VIK27_11475 [Candidatus Aquilonibacter sp.]
MNLSKCLCAAAASAMLLGLSVPASAAGLMNVISSSSSSVTGNISSHTTSWDQYAGAQLTISETSSSNGSLGANLSGLAPNNALGGNLNLYGQQTQNFGAQGNVTFFKGGDTSDTTINGHINQVQTTFSTGIQTSFGN